MSFSTPYDIANRALQHIGVPRITSFNDSSRQASECNFLYDKLRRAELRRFVWTFSTTRTILRPSTATAKVIALPAYNSATTYAAGDLVIDTVGNPYINVQSGNIGNLLTLGGPWAAFTGPKIADTWSGTITYLPGDLVISSGTLYLCVAQNLNNTPPNTTYWHAPAGASTATFINWQPLGYNQAGTSSRNSYPLPFNFMRMAPQDPKHSGVARLGTTAGMQFNDWEIESGFIFTDDTTGAIVLRFVGDTVNVPAYDDMFCEALAARMGRELNEIFTQDANKTNLCNQIYTDAVRSARAVSGIEMGSTEEDFEAALQAATQTRR